MSSVAEATCAGLPAPPEYTRFTIGLPALYEKTFSASFVPQPAENNTNGRMLRI